MPACSYCGSAAGTCACGCGRSALGRSARSQADRSGLFLALGLLGGVIGGVTLARKLNEEREPFGLKIWRRELSKTRGAVEAGFLSARIQQRYAELYAARPRFDDPTLRAHLEDHILPGLALYQTLCADCPDRESAAEELDRLFEAGMRTSTLEMQARLLGLFPDPFSIFRLYITQTLTRLYPQGQWGFRWVENTPDVVAFDATDCFYLRVLTAYGAPELTPHFCRLDDLMMVRFPFFAWKRTGTLARGNAVCDFRYERIEKN